MAFIILITLERKKKKSFQKPDTSPNRFLVCIKNYIRLWLLCWRNDKVILSKVKKGFILILSLNFDQLRRFGLSLGTTEINYIDKSAQKKLSKLKSKTFQHKSDDNQHHKISKITLRERYNENSTEKFTKPTSLFCFCFFFFISTS